MKKPRALPHVWPHRRIVEFIARIWPGPAPNHCWLWTGGCDQNGYGRFAIVGTPRSNVQAHRVAYAMFVGEVPADLTVDHMCGERRCVKPSHLQLKPAGENSATRYRKTGVAPAVTPPLEKLDEPNETTPF